MRLRYAGLRNETVYNEAPGVAVVHMDVESATLDSPSNPELVHVGGLNRGVRFRRPGYYSPSGNIVYAADIRTIGRLLRWALGGYQFTTSALPALRRHEMFGDENPNLPSFCVRLGKDHYEHVFSGCVANSLEMTVENEFCRVTTDVMAATESRATLLSFAGLLLPVDHPLAFGDVVVRIAGDAATEARVKSMTLIIENGVDVNSGRSLGSRTPRRLLATERAVTMDLELFFAGFSELDRFWGGSAGPAAIGATEFVTTVTINAGTAGSLVFNLPRAWYTNLNTRFSGKDEIIQSASIRALSGNITLFNGTTVVRSELLATLMNEEATYA